jgi:hypothetical protein
VNIGSTLKRSDAPRNAVAAKSTAGECVGGEADAEESFINKLKAVSVLGLQSAI